jgi:anti-sigma factor RsiW
MIEMIQFDETHEDFTAYLDGELTETKTLSTLRRLDRPSLRAAEHFLSQATYNREDFGGVKRAERLLDSVHEETELRRDEARLMRSR